MRNAKLGDLRFQLAGLAITDFREFQRTVGFMLLTLFKGFCCRRRHKRLQPGPQFRFGLHSRKLTHRLPIQHGHHKRYRLHTERPGDLRTLIDIDFHKAERAFGFGGQLLQNRNQLLAGTTPIRPKIHDDRAQSGLLDDIILECLHGRIDDGRCVWHKKML